MIDRDTLEFKRDLASFRTSWIGDIFPTLRHGIWHTTSPSGLQGILATGNIQPNRGAFPFTFPQSENSYGFQKGYVSLFDFGSASEEECVTFYLKWVGFFVKHEPFTIAIELDRAAIASRLIANCRAREEVGYTKVWIPWVETWHDGPVPVSAVLRYLLIPKSGRNAISLAADDPSVPQLGLSQL